ncbi:RmlC-like cupin domain-containing protein [Kalaharituber pfeilii]|nr:RmlC-like cupin domain-containing protein [Kalaharituber pfeilii]
MFHWAETQKDGSISSLYRRANDPYQYQPGFGNHFQSETSLPDKPETESCFLPLNPRVHISPTQLAWHSEEPTTFVDGMRTVAGAGEPTLREGVVNHIYTEFGYLYVQPGEIAVIQREIRFKVNLSDGPSRGYLDFLTPVTKIDDVKSLKEDWEIFAQGHSPFDVVAWHGSYIPYKYVLTKFVNVGSISVDHIDPLSSVYYGGRSNAFNPGSISFKTGMTPYGVAYPQFKAASEASPPVMQISPGSIAYMCESSSKQKHEHDPKRWDDLVDNFSGPCGGDREIAGKDTMKQIQ